jgi:hypothetical protein
MDGLTDDPTDSIMMELLKSTLPMEDQINQIQTDSINIINSIDSNNMSNNPSMDNETYLTDYEMIMNEVEQVFKQDQVSNYPSTDNMTDDPPDDPYPLLYDLYRQIKQNNINTISNQTTKLNKTNQIINTNFIQDIRFNNYNQH